jgi:hypothetical protein
LKPKSLREKRDAVLRYVYEHGSAAPNFDVPVDQIIGGLHLTRAELSDVAMLLHNQSLLAAGQANCIGLNYAGQAEAERLGPCVVMRELPSSPPQNVYIGQANKATIQIAGTRGHQYVTHTVQQSEVTALLDSIEGRLPNMPLTEENRAEASEIISALRDSTKPKSIIRALASALNSIISPFAAEFGERLVELFIGRGS